MANVTSMDFLHIFEKMSEPLGYGLRGNREDGLVYYFYKDDAKQLGNDAMMRTIGAVKQRMSQAMTSGRMKDMNITMKEIPAAPNMPMNLESVQKLCAKNTNFCYFVPGHRRAFNMLKDIFMKQEGTDKLFSLACACRDSPRINPQLFVYALSSCLVSRKDTQGFVIPSHFEVMPENYCNSAVVRQAQKMANIPPPMDDPNSSNNSNSMCIIVDQNMAGHGTDPEAKLWYFREDILVNSHHFHWHIVFPSCTPKDPKEPGHRDRRGELFYYMHHSMIARYDAERLCNGLTRTEKFSFNSLMLEDGYFGKLTSENSGRQWGTRQANTQLTDVQTVVGGNPLGVRVEELKRWRDRILETIDIGYYVKLGENGLESRVKLNTREGIDVLGNIVENSETLSPHAQYYGPFGFHNMGHVLIAGSHDPRGVYREELGVMGDVSTAMRDTAFYRWHKYIDHLFDLHKQQLSPYPLKSKDPRNELPLTWEGVEIVPNSFYVKPVDREEMNVLRTFWNYKDVDLSRGLDFRRSEMSGMRKAPVMGRFTHLDHGQFEYFMKINNKTGGSKRATIRIFMSPKYDEHGDAFNLSDQRILFFEMDKATKMLNPGVNNIRLQSIESSVTLRDENGASFSRLEKLFHEAKDRTDVIREAQCSCGWPQHLLLPRGSSGGTDYDLFVIVTDGDIDAVKESNNEPHKPTCKSALSFCGVLNKKYPDARPMGYPFDRRPFDVPVAKPNDNITEPCPAAMMEPVPSLEAYVRLIKNSASTKVTIVHERMMMKKNAAQLEEQVMCPDGTCVQLKSFYGMAEKKKNDNEERIPSRGAHGRAVDIDEPPRYTNYPTFGPSDNYNMRKGRQEDSDDWEDVYGDEYNNYD